MGREFYRGALDVGIVMDWLEPCWGVWMGCAFGSLLGVRCGDMRRCSGICSDGAWISWKHIRRQKNGVTGDTLWGYAMCAEETRG